MPIGGERQNSVQNNDVQPTDGAEKKTQPNDHKTNRLKHRRRNGLAYGSAIHRDAFQSVLLSLVYRFPFLIVTFDSNLGCLAASRQRKLDPLAPN